MIDPEAGCRVSACILCIVSGSDFATALELDLRCGKLVDLSLLCTEIADIGIKHRRGPGNIYPVGKDYITDLGYLLGPV